MLIRFVEIRPAARARLAGLISPLSAASKCHAGQAGFGSGASTAFNFDVAFVSPMVGRLGFAAGCRRQTPSNTGGLAIPDVRSALFSEGNGTRLIREAVKQVRIVLFGFGQIPANNTMYCFWLPNTDHLDAPSIISIRRLGSLLPIAGFERLGAVVQLHHRLFSRDDMGALKFSTKPSAKDPKTPRRAQHEMEVRRRNGELRIHARGCHRSIHLVGRTEDQLLWLCSQVPTFDAGKGNVR